MNSADSDEEYRRWRKVQDAPFRRNALVAWYLGITPAQRLMLAALLLGAILFNVAFPNGERYTQEPPTKPTPAVAPISDVPTETHSWLAMSAGHYVTCTTY